MNYSPTAIARQLKYIREAGQNHGLRVEGIQHWSNGQFGDSWCCELVWLVLDICTQGNCPIPRTGSCQEVYDYCKAKGWITTTPSVDDLFFYINAAGHVHHIGIVTVTSPLDGIAGNTSEDGTSSNGTGVFEHGINAKVFAHYPR